jgi:hypothetical protein
VVGLEDWQRCLHSHAPATDMAHITMYSRS